MRNFAHVFFDLDGTLMNSAPGIITAYAEVAYKMKVKTPRKNDMLSFIGQPLRDNLRTFIPEDKIDKAVEKYYHCYDRMRLGLLENAVYDGIPCTLNRLKSAGFNLYILTAKLEEFVLPILNMFDLEEYFVRALSGTRDGSLGSKRQLISKMLEMESLDPDSCVLVGDRGIDAISARENGVASICVTWGYGSLYEIQQAQPDYIVHAPEELACLLCEDHLLDKSPLIASE